jgi:prephenate dehydrogenase/chorismate mutase
MTDHKLSDLRNEIDQIDKQIAELLSKRMNVTDRVGKLKNENNLAHDDPGREDKVIENLQRQITHPILHEEIELIYQPLIDLVKKSYTLQKNKQTLPWNHIGVIGLGVIGGSIIKALKAIGYEGDISTIKREGSASNAEAREHGYISKEYDSPEELASHVDLLILASPIATVEPIAKQIRERTQRNTKLTVIDTASIKRHIGTTFEELTTDTIEFLPTHPMAGSDKSGFENGKATMFVYNPWVICPHDKSDSQTMKQIESLVSSFGAIPHALSSAKHDTYVASSSHLVRLVSMIMFAFINDKKNEAMQISGTGFEKMSALTSSNSLMNKQIYNGNFAHIQDELNEFSTYLSSFHLSENDSLAFFEKYKSLRDQFVAGKRK